MTPVLARDQKVRITISGSKFSGAGLAGILARRNYTKHLVPAIYSSWICPTPSWSNMKIVEMTTSEICAAEFAEWTIFDADLGNDDFLGECMRLFNVWLWCAEEDAPWDAWFSWKEASTPSNFVTAIADDGDDEFAPRTAFDEEERMASNDSSTSLSSLCSTWSCLTMNWKPFACRCDEELEEGMRLFAAWSAEADDEEEVLVEPESHDVPLTVALLPTKDLLPAPSAGLIRALSCPDLLMESLAVLLFETRHLAVLNLRYDRSVLNTGNWLNAGFLNAGPILLALPAPSLNSGSGLLALPAPPAWMLALEYDRETDVPNSSLTTVSLPSGWDAVSARVSSSSIFNLFSTSSASSIFPDPTGVPSLDSTVAPWETPSTVASVTGSNFTSSAPRAYPAGEPSLRTSASSLFADPTEESSSAVSIPSNFFDEVQPLTSSSFASGTTSASSLCTDQSSSFSEHVCNTSCFDDDTSASSCFADTTVESFSSDFSSSSSSSLFPDPTSSTSNASSLFPDPTSAHSCTASCFEVAPSTTSASSIFPDPRSAHSCSASCFDIPSSSSTTSASSNSSAPCDCGRLHAGETEDESNASSTTSSSSTNPYSRVRFGTYTLLPSTSESSIASSSSGYESDADAEEESDVDAVEEPAVAASEPIYDFIGPVEEPTRVFPVEEPVIVEEEPAVVETVTTVCAATQTQAPDEEVTGLDAYLVLFDEVHEMRRKLMETMGNEEENAVPADPLAPEQTYNHEEAAIISRMAIAWDALLEDTSRLLKKSFEEKRRKIRFLM